MKTLKLNALFLFLVSFSFLFSACKKDEEKKDDAANTGGTPPATTQNIVQIAQGNPNFSILVSALVKADLVTTLSGTTNYTVFAPTNDAFIAAGFTQVVIDGLDAAAVTSVLTPILLNHVLSGKIISTQISTGYVTSLASGGASINNANYSMYLSTASGVRINGIADVTNANIDATNGVIHQVDAVITLPTIATFVAADPTFSALLTAVDRAGLITSALGSATYGPVTVFAPTTAAFITAGINTATIDVTILATVLQGHLVTGNNRSSSLSDGQSITAVNTLYELNVGIASAAVSLDVTDGTQDAGVVAVDVQATNGVVHVINKVLLLN